MDNQMFCFQCQETAEGTGCKKNGVCGKEPDVALMQDLLIYVTKGLACVTTKMREEKKTVSKKVNHLITENLFMTSTNTNFDKERIANQVAKTTILKEKLLAMTRDISDLPEAARWTIVDGIRKNTHGLGVQSTKEEDIRSLRELITYGMKGIAEYMVHANALSREDEKIDAFIQKTLSKMLDESVDKEDLIEMAMETGEKGIAAMSLLDRANTGRYGAPSITNVELGVGKKPGILVSGHDFRDLEMLLEQSAASGVDIYTHSEMLPAHYYPKFKKYTHLVGNYGNSWRGQETDFDKFHGPILMTSNCVIPPSAKYSDRLWTTGVVGIPGCRHITGGYREKKDFSPIIEQAKKCDPPETLESGSILGGFAHRQALTLSTLLDNTLREGRIHKFVVIAGCDGRMESRKYYTEFARNLPDGIVVLTAGCVKYRYIKLNLSDVGRVPRVLDAGQCNDFYSLLLTIMRLKDLLGIRETNDLPVVFNIAWHGQKALIMLLALLSLGFSDIHIGPTLPAFLSPNIIKELADNYGVSRIRTVEEDLKLLFE